MCGFQHALSFGGYSPPLIDALDVWLCADVYGGEEPKMIAGGLALLEDHRSSLRFFEMGRRSDPASPFHRT